MNKAAGFTAAFVLLCASLGAAVPAVAAELFRYINDDGVVVISSNLPPRYASRGYAVIDSRGRVLREVPRQLTAEEVRARQAEEAEREAERQAADRRRAQDEELLRLYGSPEEVSRAGNRRIESIEAHIASIRAGMARLHTQQSEIEAQAAELERAGRPIPEHIVTALARIDTQLEERHAEIRSREEEIERTRESFARDRERVARLLGVPQSSPDG
ncbi:MAG: DUF4124 domain-containing protein [Gammaproteobacteria bacterium]|nr:DUF4124 domain-containing protein [Gammaproteobacteria bacterium]